MGIFDSFMRNYREANDSGMAQLRDRDKAAQKSDAPRGSHDYDGESGRMDEDEGNPVDQGYDHDDETEEAVGEFFPVGPRKTSGDASGKMAYDNGKQGDGPGGFRDSGKRLAPESEGNPAMDEPLDEPKSARVRIRCPHCGEANTVRLPGHVKLAKTSYGESQASGRLMRTSCGSCSETVRFTAPPGYKFSRESAAVQHFKNRYGYLTGRASHPIVRGLRSAREAFRRTYFDR